MGYEDIEVRITRDGEIFVKIEAAAEERLRDYQLFFEEAIGPVAAEHLTRPDWEQPAGLTFEATEQALEQSQGG